MQAERRRGTNQHAILLTNAVSSLQADQKAIEMLRVRIINCMKIQSFILDIYEERYAERYVIHIKLSNCGSVTSVMIVRDADSK